MKGFGKLVIAINWIIVLLVGVAALAWAYAIGVLVDTHPEKEIVEYVRESIGTYSLLIIGGALILINILVVVKRIKDAGYQRSIKFENPGGEVVVHLGAIEECLSKTARESEQVHDVRVRVFTGTKDRPLKVIASLSLWDTPNVPAVIERIQEGLKTRFVEILNTTDPVEVSVTLKRLVSKPKSRQRKEKDKASSPAVNTTFKGPEYPID